MRIFIAAAWIAALLIVGMGVAAADPVGQSCESRCNHKCNVAEKAQCVANCLSGYGPRCTPVPGVAHFHWPTCHDNWPDCVPPLTPGYSPGAAATMEPCTGPCPICCKYWWNPARFAECCHQHCPSVNCIKP